MIKTNLLTLFFICLLCACENSPKTRIFDCSNNPFSYLDTVCSTPKYVPSDDEHKLLLLGTNVLSQLYFFNDVVSGLRPADSRPAISDMTSNLLAASSSATSSFAVLASNMEIIKSDELNAFLLKGLKNVDPRLFSAMSVSVMSESYILGLNYNKYSKDSIECLKEKEEPYIRSYFAAIKNTYTVFLILQPGQDDGFWNNFRSKVIEDAGKKDSLILLKNPNYLIDLLARKKIITPRELFVFKAFQAKITDTTALLHKKLTIPQRIEMTRDEVRKTLDSLEVKVKNINDETFKKRCQSLFSKANSFLSSCGILKLK